MSPPSYLVEVPYGDSGTSKLTDAATSTSHSGEIEEATKATLSSKLPGNKTTVTIGNGKLSSVKYVDTRSDTLAECEARLNNSVLIILISVITVTGDVSVAVPTEVS